MAKTKRIRGMITFYIRPEFREDFEKFEKVIERDPRLIELRAKAKYGLISIAITQLILKYLDEQNEESKESETIEEVKDETDKIMD